MMSPDNKLPAGKDESQGSTGRKNTSSRPQESALKCPRCDSTNTKFCYYNNYNLTQPRHFCKTCRRYWTKGGALRNVPIGGGCRKNKKMKPFQRISGDSKDSSGSSDIGGLKFFQNISPAMDFQLGGLNFPRVHSTSTGLFNQFSSVGNISNTCGAISSSPYLNLDPSSSSSPPLLGFSTQGFHEMGSLNVHTNLASSIESLSSINQELHWKLQQQRLAMLVAGDNQKENSTLMPSNNIIETRVQKPQPILFQNLDTTSKQESYGIGTSRKEVGPNENLSTEWFFDNSYATVTPIPVTNRSFATENPGSWSGIQSWSTDLTQYTALP